MQYPLVIFHCSSSAGRGPRCATEYQQHLDALGVTHSKAAVLVGGIKAWVNEYGLESVIQLEDKSEVKL